MNSFLGAIGRLLRKLLRAWKKILLGGLAFGLLATSLLLFGLRYGFTPLPEPPPGFAIAYPLPDTVPIEQATSGWRFAREMPVVSPGASANIARSRQLIQLLGRIDWSAAFTGARLSPESFDNLCQQFETFLPADVDLTALRTILRQPEAFRPLLARSGTRAELTQQVSSVLCLRGYALALAGRAYWQNDPTLGLEYLACALQIGVQQRYTASTLGLANLWHTILLRAEPIGQETGLRLLGELDRIAASWPSLEAATTEDVLGNVIRMAEAQPFGMTWSDYRSELHEIVDAAWNNVKELPHALWAQTFGVGGPQPSFNSGSNLVRAIDVTLQYLSARLTRFEDVEQVQKAWLAEMLELIRDGKVYETSRFYRDFDARPGWLRPFDRPLVWESGRHLPDPVRLQESHLTFRRQIRSLKLLLALRVFRQQNGHWPDQLSNLVPDILPELPRVSVLEEPFRYRRHGEHWVLWIPDAARRDPQDWAFDGTEIWSVREADLSDRWRVHLKAEGFANFFGDESNLNDLAALLPEGAGDLQPDPLAARELLPVMDVRMMQRYGLLPPEEPLPTNMLLRIISP